MSRTRVLLALLVALSLVVTGCAAVVVGAAAGGGTIVWHKGKLIDQVSASVPQTFEATKAGLKSLKLPIYEQRFDNIKGKVKSELADGKNVTVSLKATQGGTTEITVRVGIVGDKDASHRILKAIKKHL